MKQYTKAEFELLTLPSQDVLTSSSPFGRMDDDGGSDNTGYGDFGLLGQ